MQTKKFSKILSTLLATAMVASAVTIPVFAAGSPVAQITNNALAPNTIYHEGPASNTGSYNQGTLGGNWYDSLIDTAGVTVESGVTGVNPTGADQAFTVNVPIKYAIGTEIEDGHDAWGELNLFKDMPHTGTKVALGFQMAIPTEIGADAPKTAIDFSASSMTRNTVLTNDMFYLGVDEANRCAIKLNSDVTNDSEAKTVVMYTNIATANKAEGETPTKYTISSSTADTQRTFVYEFKGSDSAKLATYTVKFNVTFPDAPVTIGGVISDVDGNVAGATVALYDDAGTTAINNADGDAITATSAESTGAYSLEGVPANATYTIKVTKTGYTDKSEANVVVETSNITGKNITIEKSTTPPATKKPIQFGVNEPFSGGQADGSAELGKSFGFGVRTESDGVIVTKDTIASKIDAAAAAQSSTETPNPNPAFIVYYHVDAVKGDDDTEYSKYNYYRNGVKIQDEVTIPTDEGNAFAYKADADGVGSTFKKGISLFGKVGGVWAMKYNAPFTDKLELLNDKNEVIAEVSHTFDFSGASIGDVTIPDELVPSPTVETGAPATTLPNREEVAGAMLGAKDEAGKPISAANITAVKLGVKPIPDDAAITAEITKDNTLGNKSQLVSLEIDLKAAVTGTGDVSIESLFSPITIEMETPAALRGYEKIFVFHKKTDGTVEKILAKINGKKFSFKMSSFSPISAIGSTTPPTTPTPPVTPPTPPTPPTVPNYGYGGYGGSWYSPASTNAVYFNTLGGSAVSTINVEVGSLLKFPAAPTRDGYVFSGWYFDAACTKQVPAEYRPTGSVTLYAFWQSNTPVVAPVAPTDPTAPTTPTTVPQTGDANAVPFAALLFVAAAAIVVIMVPKKKIGNK